MNEREKIIKIAMEAKWRDMFGDHHGICEPQAEAIADSLIANGYGNVAELKVELRSKVDYIHELWDVKEDYKRRAETAEAVISDLRTKLAKAEHDRKRYKAKIEKLQRNSKNG